MKLEFFPTVWSIPLGIAYYRASKFFEIRIGPFAFVAAIRKVDIDASSK